tara:strand:- start:56 stop:277 length:222 start_codon:yes stop_codon:yes gene_type:complete
LILSISACQTKINIVKACGIGNQYDDNNLGLSSASLIDDYQAALVVRKHEINKLNERASEQAICANEIQRYLK